MKIAIHTTASPKSIVNQTKGWPKTDALEQMGVHPGEAAGGQPDCFYGWGEAQDRDTCLRHTIIITSDYALARAISQRLVWLNFQCVLTDAEDWSVPYLGSAACLYRDEHQH